MNGHYVLLLIGNVVVGSCVAVFWHVHSTRGQAQTRKSQLLLEVLLLIPFWPLMLPICFGEQWSRRSTPMGQGPASAFIAALDRVSGSPLAKLLPDQQVVLQLRENFLSAQARVTELDRMLATPEFDLDRTRAHRLELETSGLSRAAASTAAREGNIRRLHALRRRFQSELIEINELLAQLQVQAELVRLVGSSSSATRDLVDELLCRVGGLDSVISDVMTPIAERDVGLAEAIEVAAGAGATSAEPVVDPSLEYPAGLPRSSRPL